MNCQLQRSGSGFQDKTKVVNMILGKRHCEHVSIMILAAALAEEFYSCDKEAQQIRQNTPSQLKICEIADKQRNK